MRCSKGEPNTHEWLNFYFGRLFITIYPGKEILRSYVSIMQERELISKACSMIMWLDMISVVWIPFAVALAARPNNSFHKKWEGKVDTLENNFLDYFEQVMETIFSLLLSIRKARNHNFLLILKAGPGDYIYEGHNMMYGMEPCKEFHPWVIKETSHSY